MSGSHARFSLAAAAFFGLLLLLGPVACAASTPAQLAQEVDALVAFRKRLAKKRALLSTWDGEAQDACSFKGVVCNDQRSVIAL